MQWAGALRRDFSARNQQIAIASGSVHELTAGEMPSVIFRTQRKPATWKFPSCFLRNICANPAWAHRLTKVHTGSRKALPTARWQWMGGVAIKVRRSNLHSQTRRVISRAPVFFDLRCQVSISAGYRVFQAAILK
jgi:hypothetical protein